MSKVDVFLCTDGGKEMYRGCFSIYMCMCLEDQTVLYLRHIQYTYEFSLT